MPLFPGSYEGASFFDLLRHDCPHLLPFQHLQHVSATRDGNNRFSLYLLPRPILSCGVLTASSWPVTDRRQRALRYRHGGLKKSIKPMSYSVIAMAGAAGPCLEMIKLFQVEMEHYHKIEGETLALDGKANKLAQMVKQNLPAAFQGLVVIPFLRATISAAAGPYLQVRCDRWAL